MAFVEDFLKGKFKMVTIIDSNNWFPTNEKLLSEVMEIHINAISAKKILCTINKGLGVKLDIKDIQ